MSLASMNFIWVVLFVLGLASVSFLLQKKKQRDLSNWINPEFWNLVIPEFSKKKHQWKWFFKFSGLLLILFSLLRPQWGEKEELIESKGMDIIFAIDVSNSMLAEDANPSRLQKTQIFIKKTLAQLADDRVGVVAFAGRAFLAIPLTNDFDYVSEIVDSMSPAAITEQGTEIGEAIDVTIKAFERGGSDSRKTSRAIILISDGEDFGKNPSDTASKIKDFGAGFFTFSVGTTEGAPVPIRSDNGVLQTYKKDRSGKTVLSRTNPELLSKIASVGGGKYFDLSNADDSAYILAKQLQSFQRDSLKEQRKITKIDRFQIFLAAGLFLLMISFSIGYQRIIPARIAQWFALILIFTSQADAQTFSGYWKNRRGVGEYESKNYEESSRIFESARSNDTENPVMEFNQATALARAEKDEDSIFHFQEATKKALNEGDYDTAAKSLYNEGLIHKKNKNYQDSFRKLTNAIEMAKISNQPELEKKAREALLQSAQEQQKQQQNNQNQDNQNQQQKEKQDQKESEGKENQKNPSEPQESKDQKREFKSGTLSKDVAESIMNDLSDREKQLYQRKIKERKTKEQQNEKDW